MNDDLTLIVAIIDRSGSMANIKKDMEGGFNRLIAEQAAAPGECRLYLTQFDTIHDVIHDYIEAKDAPPYTLVPGGGTALLDAIGFTITKVGAKLAAMSEVERPGQVMVVIVTDGEENSSREWQHDKVMALIKNQTEQWNWHFTYLGANQDAINVAVKLGIQAASAMNVGASGQSMGTAYASASSSLLRSRAAGPGGQSISYTEAERQAVRDADDDEVTTSPRS